ncbi:MAG: type II secretion system F family protein, partial [Deltaproteobacteria bacterium]|nr:type II secretion system F family protein [Deltaproteobacteria bacterium]
MPSFRYRAYDTSGKGVSGTIDAAGPREAVQLIKSSGLFPAEVAVDEAPSRGRLFGARISGQAVTIATRQLANLLSAGTPLSEALSILVENTANAGLKTV